jgi:acetyl-CoA acetyltransferase
MARRIGERDAYIAGIGQSVIGRRLGLSGVELTVQAALAAIEDAGLTPADIDGLATWPGMMPGGPPGLHGAGAHELLQTMRLNVDWYSGGLEGPAQTSALVNACMAITTGLCRNVLDFRT